MNTCLIRIANGLTIPLTHDTDSQRPYSRIILVQGTKGLVMGWPQTAVSLWNSDMVEIEWHRMRSRNDFLAP